MEKSRALGASELRGVFSNYAERGLVAVPEEIDKGQEIDLKLIVEIVPQSLMKIMSGRFVSWFDQLVWSDQDNYLLKLEVERARKDILSDLVAGGRLCVVDIGIVPTQGGLAEVVVECLERLAGARKGSRE